MMFRNPHDCLGSLIKNWLRYSWLKARLNFQKSNNLKLNLNQILKWYQLSLTSNIYISQNFSKFFLGFFWNSHDKQITKLSLGFKFYQEKGKNQYCKVKRAYNKVWLGKILKFMLLVTNTKTGVFCLVNL